MAYLLGRCNARTGNVAEVRSPEIFHGDLHIGEMSAAEVRSAHNDRLRVFLPTAIVKKSPAWIQFQAGPWALIKRQADAPHSRFGLT